MDRFVDYFVVVGYDFDRQRELLFCKFPCSSPPLLLSCLRWRRLASLPVLQPHFLST